jgi:tetratricopeptide (TPR) repeat protein
VDKARELYERSLTLKRSIGNASGELATMINLAVLDRDQGKRTEARQTLKEALARARVLTHVEYEARALRYLGELEMEEGNTAAAREHLAAALTLYTQLKMPANVAEIQALLNEVPASPPRPRTRTP